MRKLRLIFFPLAMMTSCSVSEYRVDDEVVDLNWNNAVKDLYLMEEVAMDTTGRGNLITENKKGIHDF